MKSMALISLLVILSVDSRAATPPDGSRSASRFNELLIDALGRSRKKAGPNVCLVRAEYAAWPTRFREEESYHFSFYDPDVPSEEIRHPHYEYTSLGDDWEPREVLLQVNVTKPRCISEMPVSIKDALKTAAKKGFVWSKSESLFVARSLRTKGHEGFWPVRQTTPYDREVWLLYTSADTAADARAAVVPVNYIVIDAESGKVVKKKP